MESLKYIIIVNISSFLQYTETAAASHKNTHNNIFYWDIKKKHKGTYIKYSAVSKFLCSLACHKNSECGVFEWNEMVNLIVF